VVYASEHAALAVLEVLVHVTTADLPAFRITSAALPEEAIGRIPPARLPPAWAAYPFGPASQAVGDAWLAAGDDVALRVPSALVPGDNVLLNPLHPGFRRLARDDGVLPIPAATRLR
jgi:RES domain-containing protein